MMKRRDLTGKKYGFLTVIKYFEGRKWECLCDCGNIKNICSKNFIDGSTKSCGCKIYKTHGMTGTVEYRSWAHAIGRCEDKNDKAYKNYGGRGIKVCERWRNSFENFFLDMGKRPSGYSIERIDVNGNYEPLNCKWATTLEQSRNKRNTKKYDYKGEQLTLMEIVALTGLPKTTAFRWLNANQSLDKKPWARFT